MILSLSAGVPMKRTTTTIVRPPFVAIFKMRAPASRYCELARSKVTWPLPCGPPSALYTGRMADPTGVLPRDDTDENEGRAATRAKNLAQAAPEVTEQPFAMAADDLYFPATHAVHVPPSGPVHPALQVQFVRAALPAGEVEFDGQAMHVEVDVAPTPVEYVPCPQTVVTRQTANTPVALSLPSEVKTTSRYPVDDV